MSKVFIKKCSSYDEYQLIEIFESILSSIDSVTSLKAGSSVLLKTNLLIRKKPDAAATTHPAFLRALAQVLISRGFKVIIGDSPGGLFNKAFLKSVYEECGLTEAFKNMNVELNYNTDAIIVRNPGGRKPKEFSVTQYIHNADYVINVPKLKSHVAMTYTGAIKNWYGTIAGERKFDYHVVASTADKFANMLIDIYLLNKPDLTILDAVVGMDHNGPAAGKPINTKLILASEDGFALDATALRILGIDPRKVPVTKAALERKLISENIDAVEISGESINSVRIHDFKLPDTVQQPVSPFTGSRLFTHLTESIKPRVGFDHIICIRCGDCVKNCPVTAIDIRNGRPRVRHGKCIKCFCCYELCTANAVKIKPSLVLKSLLMLGLLNRRLQISIEKMFGMIARNRR